MRRWLAILVLAACESSREQPQPTPALPPAVTPAPPATDATPLVAKFECHRCHAGTGVADVPRDEHCVGCHQDILAARFVAPPDVLARWQGNLTSLRFVPSLTGVGARLRRSWVEQFLRAPHDVRPGLPATMPRLAIEQAEAATLASHLVPSEVADPPPFTAAEVAAGKALYEARYCAACHAFTGAGVASPPIDPTVDAQALAPDLAFARARLQRGAVADLIADPRRHKADALMPKLELAPDAARALAAFVLETPLSAPAAGALPPRLPLLDRPVTWDEVSEKVFRTVCWHCHSTPDYALGDGGPGNTGGFGFAPRGLDLARHSAIMSGAFGDDGKRRSIFAPMPDGTPRLVAVLLARQAEEAGYAGPVRGMPLGLPALRPEQIQLVETWIAQGRKP